MRRAPPYVSRRRGWVPAAALVLAAGLAALPARAGPDWRAARAWAGYRLTAGSHDYVGHDLLLRARLAVTPLWSGYSRLDLVFDRDYDQALTWMLGGERDLPRDWLGWAGAGFSAAGLKDGGSASSFRFEAGAGRGLADWWADAEYRLVSGKVGEVVPAGARGSGGSGTAGPGAMTAQQMSAMPGTGRGEPALSAPASTGESFTQNELTLLVLSPEFRLLKPAYVGLSASYWTRTDGPDGWTPYASLELRLTRRWSAFLGAWSDLPTRGSSQYYGSAGLAYAFLAGGRRRPSLKP